MTKAASSELKLPTYSLTVLVPQISAKFLHASADCALSEHPSHLQ
jgi:hypothetical protein